MVKNLLASEGDTGNRFDTWVGETPLRMTQQPTPVPGKSHRHRSLVGYSLWGYRVGHGLATEHTHIQHYIY